MSSSGPNNPDPWGQPGQGQPSQPTGWERPGSQPSASSQDSASQPPASQPSGSDWPGYPPSSQPSAPEPTRPLNDPPTASQTGYQPYEQLPSYGSGNPTGGGGYGANPYDQQQVNPYQQNPDQPYGAYQAYAVAPQHPQATTAFVLGLLGLVLCPPVGIGGFVMGGRVRREIDASNGAQGGRGLATAGWVLGIISIVSTVLLVLYIVFVVVIGVAGGFN